MDNAKRRAFIKQQTTKKKLEAGQPSKGTGSSVPSKRKHTKKPGHQSKKPKPTTKPVVGLEVDPKKTVTPIGPGKGKGLMKGLITAIEKAPVLLREDSEYALERLSSILTINNYEDFGNHAREAMGETGLFTIA